MFYVITCFDRSLRRVVTTVDHAIEVTQGLGLSQCVVSGYDSPDGLVVQKTVEKLDEFYLNFRFRRPEDVDKIYDAYGEILIGLIQLSLAAGELEMVLHAKGPGEVIAVQLEDSEE